MARIRLDNGYVILRTPKAEKLVDELVRNGTFWEHVSELLEKEANEDPLLKQLLSRLDTMGTLNYSGDVGASASNIPTVSEVASVPVVRREKRETKEVKLDYSKKNPMDLIFGMKKRKGSD